MTNVVPVATCSGAWTEWELRALSDLQRSLERRGLSTDYQHGITDDGVPWISFFEEGDGSFVAHIAREPGNYLLICSDRTVERSPALTRILQIVRHQCKHDPRAVQWFASR